MTRDSDPVFSEIPRRSFLISSAAIGVSASLGAAAASEPSGNAIRLPRPSMSRVMTAELGEAARCAPWGSGVRAIIPNALSGVEVCALRVSPLASPLHQIHAAADLELYYPTPRLWSLLWTVEPAIAREANGAPHSMAASVDSVTHHDQAGSVRIRVTVRPTQGENSRSHEFALPSSPGSFALGIPVAQGARLPAWRRCSIPAEEGASGEGLPRVEGLVSNTIHDPWRPSDAAPGCVLVRIDLSTTADLSADHGGE